MVRVEADEGLSGSQRLSLEEAHLSLASDAIDAVPDLEVPKFVFFDCMSVLLAFDPAKGAPRVQPESVRRILVSC